MSLADALRAGAPLIGTFIKTPHPMIVEALGATGLDFVILDAEHSTFGITEIDRCGLAARAVGKPWLVRLADDRPADILRVIDCGADGVLIPHAITAEQVTRIVRSARFGEGGRGYSATNRAGDYGQRTMAQHLAASADPVVVPQIEDPVAVDNIEKIAAVEGVSALFVGPADLAVAFGVTDLGDPKVTQAVDHIIAVASGASIPVATFASSMDQVPGLLARGVQMIAVASEHKPMQMFFGVDTIAKAKGGAK
jgi:2-keto-3-deoxy-L-rhamnonate aldolase RhmA